MSVYVIVSFMSAYFTVTIRLYAEGSGTYYVLFQLNYI